MKVDVQSIDFTADQKLKDFIQRKLDKLENVYDRVVQARVYLKVLNTSEPENKISEILLSIPGDDLIVKRTAKTFEGGVDEGIGALKRQLKKRKAKLNSYA